MKPLLHLDGGVIQPLEVRTSSRAVARLEDLAWSAPARATSTSRFTTWTTPSRPGGSPNGCVHVCRRWDEWSSRRSGRSSGRMSDRVCSPSSSPRTRPCGRGAVLHSGRRDDNVVHSLIRRCPASPTRCLASSGAIPPVRRSAAVEQTLAARRQVAGLAAARSRHQPGVAGCRRFRRGWCSTRKHRDSRRRPHPDSTIAECFAGGTTFPASGAGSAVLDGCRCR